jgi:uncharacterized MAPEG superfamily protein
MSPSLVALLGYGAWTMALLGGIALLRGSLTGYGLRAANSFTVSGDDVSLFSARLCRAHANCYENLPIFASIIVVAALGGYTHVTDPLALWVLAARVAQSTVHLISTTNQAVMLRFTCMLAQLVIQGYWIGMLLGL